MRDIEVTEIYLDLDDVLNHFTSTVGFLFGTTQSTYDLSWHPKDVGFDLFAAIRKHYATSGGDLSRCPRSAEQMWKTLTHNDWANVMPVLHMDEMLDLCCSEVGEENVFIATSPTKCPQAASGKVEWINNYLPEWLRRQYFITPRKWMLSGPGRMLIDDHKDNCDKWTKRGGLAYLVPKPWNCPDWQPGDDVEFVMEVLNPCQ